MPPPAGGLHGLVAGTRYNVWVPPEVTGNSPSTSGRHRPRGPLDAIRELYGYEYTGQRQPHRHPVNSVQTRIFQINYLASRRREVSDMRITSSSPSAWSRPGGSGSGGSSGTTTAATPAVTGP